MCSYNDNLHKNAPPHSYESARQMRVDSTMAEWILWQRLRNKQVGGLKFRRQHPIDKFIADFYCHEKKLVIELDGGIHRRKEQQDLDKGRTETFNEFGISVLRFKNEEVINNVEDVISRIIETTFTGTDKQTNK